MKKNIFILMISALFLFACAENKTKKEDKTKEVPKVENSTKEINSLDSITNQLEKAKEDLDNTAKEVDELLNEL